MTSNQETELFRTRSQGQGRQGQWQENLTTSQRTRSPSRTVSKRLQYKRSSSRFESDVEDDEYEAADHDVGEGEQEVTSPEGTRKRKLSAKGPPRRRIRKPLQRAHTEEADEAFRVEGSNIDVEAELPPGVFQNRLLSVLTGIDRKLGVLTNEQRKGNELLEKLQTAANTGVSKRGATELNSRILQAAWQISKDNAYPSDEAIGKAAANLLGSQSYEEAVAEKGVKEVMEIKGKIRSRVTNVIRGDTASLIKKYLIRTYTEEHPEIIMEEAGKQYTDDQLAAELASGQQYRVGPLESANQKEQPYASVAFRKLLVLAYPSLTQKEIDVKSDTIDYLGRGHIAFAENLIWWLLKGNHEVPKDSHPKFAAYKDNYMKVLVDVATRQDTAELKLLRSS